VENDDLGDTIEELANHNDDLVINEADLRTLQAAIY
jgi:hypothetical protein